MGNPGVSAITRPSGEDPEPESLASEVVEAQERVTEAFREDGWTQVDVPPPDEDVIALSPEALEDAKRAESVLTQLRTQTPQTEVELEHAEQIAVDLQLDPRYRRAAIEALTRSSSIEAQGALMRLVGSPNHSESERRLALAGIRPSSSQDAAALYLREWVESSKFPERLKDQAAATWVARALLDGTDRQAALAHWSRREKPRISRLWNALTGGS
jgi:hypothetical protein